MNGEQTAAGRQAKHEAILARAIEAFAKDGFQNADIQAVAAKAGVGYGTVYRYFRTKEDLFWHATYAVLERLDAHLRESIRECPAAIDALRAAGLAYARFFEANPQYLGVFVESRAEFHGRIPPSHQAFHEEMEQLFVKVVERGIAAGEIRPVDPRSVVLSLGCVLYGAVMFGCYVEGRLRLSELAERATEIFLEGIRSAPGSGASEL